MLSEILIAFILVAVTVLVQAVGLTALLKALVKSVRTAADAILAHHLAADPRDVGTDPHSCDRDRGLGAVLLVAVNVCPTLGSSFYFSGVTYATIGYGDLVLPKEWQLFGPLEGLTGILMCGLSTAFFFAVMSKMLRARTETRQS